MDGFIDGFRKEGLPVGLCVCVIVGGGDGKGVGELLGGRAAVGCNEGRDEGRDEGEIGVWVGV